MAQDTPAMGDGVARAGSLVPAPPPVLVLYLMAVLAMIITAWLSRRFSGKG